MKSHIKSPKQQETEPHRADRLSRRRGANPALGRLLQDPRTVLAASADAGPDGLLALQAQSGNVAVTTALNRATHPLAKVKPLDASSRRAASNPAQKRLATAFARGRQEAPGAPKYHSGTRALPQVVARHKPGSPLVQDKKRRITFGDQEGSTVTADPATAATPQKVIEDYNEMIQTTLNNLRDAWQDGINNFQTEMQFPSKGEATPQIATAFLKAARDELLGFLKGSIDAAFPGVGSAIGSVVSVVAAIDKEIERAKKAGQNMALGAFIVELRRTVGNRLNDLRQSQKVKRKNALYRDFLRNYAGKAKEAERYYFFKNATQVLGTLKIHSDPITRSLAVTWIRENFRQSFNWASQLVTQGAIEIKYDVYHQGKNRVYEFKHARVKAPQGGRIAKAINGTFGGRPIDVGALRCRKKVILEKIDKGLIFDTVDRYKSEEGLLDEYNRRVAGYLGAFGWYQNLPRGLVVSRLEE